MKTDEEIYDFKMECREQALRDQKHKEDMRSDINYFFEHSNFEELKNAYDKLHKKMWEYGWFGDPKEYL